MIIQPVYITSRTSQRWNNDFLCLQISDICEPAVWTPGLDDTGVRGPFNFRGGQRYSPYIIAALLRRGVRRTDARDPNDDTNFENDTHSSRYLHGNSSSFFWLSFLPSCTPDFLKSRGSCTLRVAGDEWALSAFIW